jgi:hypothetical protein
MDYNVELDQQAKELQLLLRSIGTTFYLGVQRMFKDRLDFCILFV